VRRASCLVTLLLAAGLAACSGRPAAPAPAPTPTYPALPRPVRFGEVPVNTPTVHDGTLQFTVIGYTDNLSEVFGSHAEWFPHGRYAMVRLVLENTARIQQNFQARRQMLRTADGRSYAADRDAANIKRQPWEQLVGSEVRIEFDLYYDIPKDAKVTAIRFYADPPGPGAAVRLPTG
jgi:hypothetical protein